MGIRTLGKVRFLKSRNAARPQVIDYRPHGCGGVRHEHQNIAANDRIKILWEGQLSTSPAANDTLLHPASRARLRAVSRIEGFVSMPTTWPFEPTSRATRNATSPAPLPRSSTFIPGPMPASRNRRSVNGWRNAAWICSRSVSSALRPRAYRGSVMFSLRSFEANAILGS